MMTNSITMNARRRTGKRQAGFTLVELLIAMAIFLVIGAAAVKLVRAHIPLVSSSSNQAGLNMALRSVVAQMQIDVINAGTGFIDITNPTWNLGIVVTNNVVPSGSTTCHATGTFTYNASCFDSLSILTNDPGTPVSTPTDSTGAACADTGNTTLFLKPRTGTAAALAATYKKGDQILLVNNGGAFIASFILTDKPGVNGAGTLVSIPHSATSTGGPGAGGLSSSSDDPLGLTTSMITSPTFTLGNSFCPTGSPDFAYKVSSITYRVDATDPTNPKLIRSQNGATDVVAEQVIGFKVGASTFNTATGDSPYSYDSKTNYSNNWQAIRAVRVSVIGRTPPLSDVNDTFRNGFDKGPYRVEAVSVVINPRNLSMND